jgi:LPXTG-motif cell wall-anchored protein
MLFNKIIFVIGLITALVGVFLMFERNILGENTTTIALIVGVVGVILIAVSGGIWGKRRQS